MARVRLTFPEPALFTTDLPVRIADINYGNHLGHDRLISMLHEARVQFFGHLGFAEADVEGAGIILVDLAVSYREQVFHGQTLRVEMAAEDVRPRGFDLHYRVTTVPTAALIAQAKTGLLFFDYARKEVVAMPPRFAAALGAS